MWIPREKLQLSLKNVVAIVLLCGILVQTTHAETLPDWNDEAAAYAAQGLSVAGARLHILQDQSSDRVAKFTGTSGFSNTHNDTEGDELWVAYQMYRRLNGIHQEAADAWLTRAQNLANFFKNSYVDGAAWVGDESYNFDHIYGRGLCEWAKGESDPAAITAINAIIEKMIEWNSTYGANTPGDDLFNSGSGGRRWARQLRIAVCAAELSPSSTNIGWRNKVVDLMIQAPDWDAVRKAYWLGSNPTNSSSRLGSGAYENGDRITIGFHMGMWMEALWQAWNVLSTENDSRAGTVAQRIVDMATFFRDFPLDGNGFLKLDIGYNLNTGEPILAAGDGSPDGVYTIPPINGLVFAYKLTGDKTYLNRAWVLFKNWQKSPALDGQAGYIEHFVDSKMSSGSGYRLLSYNKGELQYVYALFENGGNPSLVDGSVDPTVPPPRTPLPPTLISDPASPIATVELSATPMTIYSGETTTLNWTSTETISCDASGGWTGVKPTSGTETTPALSSTTVFALDCSGSQGSASDTVTVTVNQTSPPSPPPTSGNPSWYANAADKTWINMTSAVGASTFEQNDPLITFPNWDFGSAQSGGDHHTGKVNQWNGAIARNNYYVIGMTGGHRASASNAVFEFGPFNSEKPNWHWYGTDPEKYDIPTHTGSPNATISSWANEENRNFYSDGRPSTTHSYDHHVFVPNLGNGVGNVLFNPMSTRLWSGADANSARTPVASSFRFNSDDDVGGFYEAENTYPDYPGKYGGGSIAEWDPVTERVWIFGTGSAGNFTRPVHSYDPVTNTYTLHAEDVDGSFASDTEGGTIDWKNRIMVVHNNSPSSGLLVIDLSSGREGESVFITRYSGGISTNGNIGMEYEPIGQKIVGYDGGENIYTMEPPADFRRSDGSLNGSASWNWELVSNGSGGARPSAPNGDGTYGRFRYIPSIRAFAVINQPEDPMYVYKIPSNGL